MIQFEARDNESKEPLNILVSVKPTTEVGWTTIQVSHTGSIYTTMWSPVAGGLHDLKIEATDENGNKTVISQIGGIYVN